MEMNKLYIGLDLGTKFHVKLLKIGFMIELCKIEYAYYLSHLRLDIIVESMIQICKIKALRMTNCYYACYYMFGELVLCLKFSICRVKTMSLKLVANK